MNLLIKIIGLIILIAILLLSIKISNNISDELPRRKKGIDLLKSIDSIIISTTNKNNIVIDSINKLSNNKKQINNYYETIYKTYQDTILVSDDSITSFIRLEITRKRSMLYK